MFLILFLMIFSLGFSQKKKKAKTKVVAEKETVIIYTEAEAETSVEPRIIAGFLKQNPGHARTDFFKKKLLYFYSINFFNILFIFCLGCG